MRRCRANRQYNALELNEGADVVHFAELSIIGIGLIADETADLPWYDTNAPIIFLVILACMLGFGAFAWYAEHRTHKLYPDQDKRGEREIRRLKEEEEAQAQASVGAGALPAASASREAGDSGVSIKQSKAEGKQHKRAEKQEAKEEKMFGSKKDKKKKRGSGAPAEKAEPTYTMPGNGQWANAGNVGPKPVAASYTAGDGSTATQTVDPDGTITCHFYVGDKLNDLAIDEYVADDNSVVKALAFSYKLGDGGTATQTVSAGGTIVVHYYDGDQLVERAVSHYVARDGSLVDAPVPSPEAQVSTVPLNKADGTGNDGENYNIGEALTSLWGDKKFEESGFYGVINDFASDMKETGGELKEAIKAPTPEQAAKQAAAEKAAAEAAAAEAAPAAVETAAETSEAQAETDTVEAVPEAAPEPTSPEGASADKATEN